MGMREYSDLVLVAEDVQKDEWGIIDKFTVRVFDSPVGQGEKKEIVIIPKELIGLIQDLERRSLDQNVERQIELGEILAELLLPEYAREIFFASYNRLNEDQGLRLRLRFADELADFPWEYMYIQREHGEKTSSNFLALDPKISIVRHEAIAVPCDWFKSQSPNTRRIVIAMASPEPYERYRKLDNLPKEQKLIREALNSIPGIEAEFFPDYSSTDVDALPGFTVKNLVDALSEHTDVFHFSGHGEFDKRNGPAYGSIIGEGGIVLADQNNQAAMIPGDRLSEVLHNRGVKLAILGACETGRRDGHNVWSSVVASLLKKEIPAVVSMQFTIMDRLAAEFSAALYHGLVAGKTIDEAVSLGRSAIRMEALNGNSDVRDWGVPVLYLRSPGGRVFQPIGDDEARSKAEENLGHLIKQQIRAVSEQGKMIGATIGELKEDTVTIHQDIMENVKGIVVGADVFSIEGGHLIINQKADVVDGYMEGLNAKHVGGGGIEVKEDVGIVKGTLVGAHIGTIGGPAAGQQATGMPSEDEVLAKLGKTLLVQPEWYSEDEIHRADPNLGKEVKFCSQCGRKLSPIDKFCQECGTKT